MRQQLERNPGSKDLIELRESIEQFVELQTTSINELKALDASSAPPTTSAAPPPPSPPPPPPPPPETDQWSRDQHPAFKKSGDRHPQSQPDSSNAATPPPPVTFKVNDTVSAKWLAGDKRFYDAKITAISGKSTDPVYTVVFLVDNSTGTVRQHEVRPLQDPSKPSTTDPTTSIPSAGPASSTSGSFNSGTFSSTPGQPSSQPQLNPGFKKGKPGSGAAGNTASTSTAETPLDPSAPQPARKIRNKRELEDGKNKWQQFKKSKVGARKESIFRTGDSVTARGMSWHFPSFPPISRIVYPSFFIQRANSHRYAVGFTGSGQAMRKDAARSRHTYEYAEEEY